MNCIKDITETEKITKDRSRHEGCQSTSMILHYHLNFSAQERRKDSDAKLLKFSLKHAYLRCLLGVAAYGNPTSSPLSLSLSAS
jgi:hypothetical protein